MNPRLIVFNAVYYFILFLFYYQTQKDPSTSLGIGFMATFFMIAGSSLLIILILRKTIRIRNAWDWAGTFLATPLPLILFVSIMFAVKGGETASTWVRPIGQYRYRQVDYRYGNGSMKRIEHYRNTDTISENSPWQETDEWVKDSTWLYFSESGDTIKKIKY